MSVLKKYSVITVSGGILYTIIEILWRGYSHWTMTLLGGICFSMLYFIHENANESPLVLKCLAGAAFITMMEYFVGCIVNLYLDWNVWSYSSLRFNLFGQISLMFTLLWFFLCIPGFYLCSFVRKLIDKIIN